MSRLVNHYRRFQSSVLPRETGPAFRVNLLGLLEFKYGVMKFLRNVDKEQHPKRL